MSMPKSSFADIIRDWESLLRAVDDHAGLLPDIERHREALKQHLEETQAQKARQDLARATRQKNTQSLRAKVEKGKELAKRVRGVVMANIGPTDELLVQFGIAPQRKRGRRLERPVEEPQTTPAPAGTPRPEPTTTSN
jgi:uncharacterized protein YPO0396